jgi:hypothetical protein
MYVSKYILFGFVSKQALLPYTVAILSLHSYFLL